MGFGGGAALTIAAMSLISIALKYSTAAARTSMTLVLGSSTGTGPACAVATCMAALNPRSAVCSRWGRLASSGSQVKTMSNSSR